MNDRELLTRAIEASGLSARKFAVQVLIRDEHQIRDWLLGKKPLPRVVRDYLKSRLGQ